MAKKSKALARTDSVELIKTADVLYQHIAEVLDESRRMVYRAVNFAMTQSYWNIGRIIVEEEQSGQDRAEYGQFLIKELSKRLTENFGKGFTATNLKYMRQFFLAFPKGHALRDELSWTHYRLLLKIENEQARQFYEAEAINSRWSTREIERERVQFEIEEKLKVG